MNLSQQQIIWIAIGVFLFVVNLPFVAYLLLNRKTDMAVLSQFQPVIDELNAAVTAIQGLHGALPPGAASAQDVADTLAAVQTAADAVKTAAQLPAAA